MENNNSHTCQYIPLPTQNQPVLRLQSDTQHKATLNHHQPSCCFSKHRDLHPNHPPSLSTKIPYPKQAGTLPKASFFYSLKHLSLSTSVFMQSFTIRRTDQLGQKQSLFYTSSFFLSSDKQLPNYLHTSILLSHYLHKL